ncbi:hypothetical protein EVAR_75844_1 [Eumeta japonica]|uniref:Uncharacterized protein n=1 Tax=Eumeta variegata TaxID=151549 RepID=A0A4C1TD30_EUMVA|nr:hypothetical protein EVAR_75844_1 [Eumeta japonica]
MSAGSPGPPPRRPPNRAGCGGGRGARAARAPALIGADCVGNRRYPVPSPHPLPLYYGCQSGNTPYSYLYCYFITSPSYPSNKGK